MGASALPFVRAQQEQRAPPAFRVYSRGASGDLARQKQVAGVREEAAGEVPSAAVREAANRPETKAFWQQAAGAQWVAPQWEWIG